MKKKVAIIGSHGLYANYGGWDQLVKNLAEKKSENIEYLIFNSSDSPKNIVTPPGVTVKFSKLKASGFEGLFYDFWSIIYCFRKVDAFLLLGVQGIPLLVILNIFKRSKIVSNVGGIEWERPKFSFFSKQYLKFCFKLSIRFSDAVILDNLHYKKFLPKKPKAKVEVIPYGGEIDYSLNSDEKMEDKYPFLKDDYFLSISRSLKDNMIEELCNCFKDVKYKLVLISNFSSSEYGKNVFNQFNSFSNIILINGLYNKPELDLIRRKSKAYIHTHTLCGTAPSLVEMIIAHRPILSIDIPQNRFTLDNHAFFFKEFNDLRDLLDSQQDLQQFLPLDKLKSNYDWLKIVQEYESLY